MTEEWTDMQPTPRTRDLGEYLSVRGKGEIVLSRALMRRLGWTRSENEVCMVAVRIHPDGRIRVTEHGNLQLVQDKAGNGVIKSKIANAPGRWRVEACEGGIQTTGDDLFHGSRTVPGRGKRKGSAD